MNTVKVKICGIRTLEAARVAVDSGADFLGFNFVPESKRYIKPEKVMEILSAKGLQNDKVKIVGVFQNAAIDEVNSIADELLLDYVQLHGSEGRGYAKQLNRPVIKAFSIHKNSRREENLALLRLWNAAYYLIDREKQGEGEQPDAQKAKELSNYLPIILAGGLTPENVADVVQSVHPFAVDVAGGIETDGEQDIEKIKIFIKRAKGDSETLQRRARQVQNDIMKKTNGHFGKYGGRYVPEMLIPALEELEVAFVTAKKDKSFQKEFAALLRDFCGRPTPLTYAENLTKKLGGAKIYLKNEGLNITGAHKITHCVGQVLLAKRMGKKRIIAETGAGQHGLASATVAAKFGMECIIYMGEVDYKRQRPNVFSMEQLGATVIPVMHGNKTLKDAVNAALKDWIENVADSYYMLGSVLGPHPYPSITKYFQSVVGREVKKQIKQFEGRMPDVVIACVSGGSNAIGIFSEFLKEKDVQLIGVEAGGRGKGVGENATRFDKKTVGIVQGYKSYFIQDTDGQLLPTHSISAGLDYAGVGPEIANLFDEKRITMTSATDKEVLHAYQMLAQTEGIIPALESAHAVAEAIKLAPTLSKNKTIVINLSGRGDKDLFIVAEALGDEKFYEFLEDYLKGRSK